MISKEGETFKRVHSCLLQSNESNIIHIYYLVNYLPIFYNFRLPYNSHKNGGKCGVVRKDPSPSLI